VSEQENEYGDFEEIKENEPASAPKKPEEQPQQQLPIRVKIPKDGQFIGIVTQRLGGKRMSVKTTDNKVRNCRVPGRFRRKFWLREGNYVIVEPWPDDDSKGDIVHQYRRPGEIMQLKKRNLVNNLKSGF